MQHFEASERMPAIKEVVFDELTRLDVLDRWLPDHVHPRAAAATPQADAAHEPVGPAPDEVREGSLDIDPARCRVEWSGGAGAEEYAGWIHVADSGAGASEVTVHLALADDSVAPGRANIDTALAASLQELYLTVSKRVTSP